MANKLTNNIPIDLKNTENEVAQIANRQPSTPINMLDLHNEVQNLKNSNNNESGDFLIYEIVNGEGSFIDYEKYKNYSIMLLNSLGKSNLQIGAESGGSYTAITDITSGTEEFINLYDERNSFSVNDNTMFLNKEENKIMSLDTVNEFIANMYGSFQYQMYGTVYSRDSNIDITISVGHTSNGNPHLVFSEDKTKCKILFDDTDINMTLILVNLSKKPENYYYFNTKQEALDLIKSFNISSTDFSNTTLEFSDSVTELNYLFQNSNISKSPKNIIAKNATSASQLFSGCNKMKELSGTIFKNCPNIKNLSYCFEECSSLTTIPQGLFDTVCHNIESINYCFYKCSKIKTIPSLLFKNFTKATTFSSCFKNTSLTSIPENLFKDCVEVKYFNSCFENCKSLTNIPENLFSGCINSTDFENCFKNTSLISIPENLFYNCTKITNFEGCFYGTNIVTIPENLFRNCINVKVFGESSIGNDNNGCFENCRSLTNIPENLFSSCINVISFENCFKDCISLVSIPEKLFENCIEVTNFESCFSNTSINNIPDNLFITCKKIKNLNSCFSYTNITEIPENLFKNCPDINNFNYCFSNCKHLVSIPSKLFSNSNVYSLYNCFRYCSNLISIPQGLFNNLVNLSDIQNCFESCTLLTTIPQGLFNNLVNLEDIQSCFEDCSSLTTVPFDLLNNCPKLTYVGSCFENCTNITSSLPDVWNESKFPKININYWKNTGYAKNCTKAANYSEIPPRLK